MKNIKLEYNDDKIYEATNSKIILDYLGIHDISTSLIFP